MTKDGLAVRTISPTTHLDFVRAQFGGRCSAGYQASFLQLPAWGQVKAEWEAESIGWYDGEQLVGVALVLYRQLPRVKRFLAYLPEGPLIEWDDEDLARWLNPMAAHLRKHGAFGIRIGPPVITARWNAAQIKDGVADDAVTSLTSVPPYLRSPAGARVVSQLHEIGWTRQGAEDGFAAGQPKYNFWIPLRDGQGAARSADDLLAGMNQQWRRNIKKAAKAGVQVSRASDPAAPDDGLQAFHELYVRTAERDGFIPRPLSYFQTMQTALIRQDPEGCVDFRVYLAHHEGDLVAATIWIRVGTHTWYSYGASSTEKRDVRGSNAIQWQMIQDSLAAGAEVYDLRGITDTLARDDPHLGLIQFKVGTGGEAVEYAGEWDLPLNRVIYRAFQIYLRRRG